MINSREERTALAASIAKQLEDATIDDVAPESEWISILELAAALLWPGSGARLFLKGINEF